MTTRMPRKREKRGVARNATPDQAIAFNPVTARYLGMSSAKVVLALRHSELRSWRVLAYELGCNVGTLYNIAKHGRQPSTKLIEKMNRIYHSNVVSLTPIHVQPLSCGHAPLAKRCPICTPASDARKRRRIDITSLKSDDAAFVEKFVREKRK